MRSQGARRSRTLPDVLSDEEQRALLAQPNPRYPTGERNRLMLSVMLNTGLRLSEATGLQWRDIDLNTGKLFVRQGKGAKDRTLWLGDGDMEGLRTWRARQASSVGAMTPHVFSTLRGGPVSSRYVQQMVRRYAAKAGIQKRVHPHLLRHVFATDLLRDTGNIRLVQKALGHADLSTTEIYTHIYDKELRDAMIPLGSRNSHLPNQPPLRA